MRGVVMARRSSQPLRARRMRCHTGSTSPQAAGTRRITFASLKQTISGSSPWIGVTSLTDLPRHAFHSHFRRWQTQKEQLNGITQMSPSRYKPRIAWARHSSFKRKTLAFVHMPLNSIEHDACSLARFVGQTRTGPIAIEMSWWTARRICRWGTAAGPMTRWFYG